MIKVCEFQLNFKWISKKYPFFIQENFLFGRLEIFTRAIVEHLWIEVLTFFFGLYLEFKVILLDKISWKLAFCPKI